MKIIDSEEKEIIEAFEAGKLKRVAGVKREIRRHAQYAAATFKKDSRINIRIPSKDLRALQKHALNEGLPYQTLISSILHKFAEGQLTSSPSRPTRHRRAGG